VSQNLLANLPKRRELCSVEVHRNGQVTLWWELTVLQMRMADLLVLNRALRVWVEAGEQNCAQQYILWLNDCAMFLRCDNLYRFCAMIDEAAAQAPNRVVRWADLTVRLVPLGATDGRKNHCFSLN
jgi:hypothetical protein